MTRRPPSSPLFPYTTLSRSRLRPRALQPPQHDPDVVQQGRAIDFVFHLASSGFLEGGGEGLERGEMRSERAGTEASVPVVVRLHPRLRRRDGVEVPAQIEVRTLDLAERPYRHTACFSSRWHSSSESTRSVRFAASNSTRHAASSSASYPCVSSQDRKSTRLNSSHGYISYAVFCLKKKKKQSTDAIRCYRT